MDLNSTARVTVADVLDIIDTDLEESQINAFINTANNLVNSLPANASLTEDKLKYIELWLSAHFLSMRDMRASQERIGSEYAVTYQGKTETGLEATLYGQQALLLDPTGTLATLGQKAAYIEIISEYDGTE